MLVHQERWDLCTYFCGFNTVLFKQKLLQLVLWNKEVPLKEQGYNGYPQINILFNFFLNQPRTACYNGWLQKVL